MSLIKTKLDTILKYKKYKKKKSVSASKRAPSGYVTGRVGEHIPKEKAIRLGGYYYELGKTAVMIRGQVYRANDAGIVKDSFTGEFDMASFLKKGIIDAEKSDGYFSKEAPWVEVRIPEQPLSLNSFHTKLVMTEEVAIAAGFVECLNSGYFYPKGVQSEYHDHKRPCQNYEGRVNLVEKLGQTPQSIAENTRYGTASATFSKTEGKKYTFGIEIETSQGYLPVQVRKRFNLSCMRDASVTGGEFVTGILTGDQGLIHLRSIVYELARRCEVDNKCGLHVHIGGFIADKEFSVYSYMLGLLLQQEIANILPVSRRNNEYAQFLSEEDTPSKQIRNAFKEILSADKTTYDFLISESYDVLFKWLSGGVAVGSDYNKSKIHPKGRYCGGHSSPRYKWLNLIPTNFSRMRLDSGQSGAIDGGNTYAGIRFTTPPSPNPRSRRAGDNRPSNGGRPPWYMDETELTEEHNESDFEEVPQDNPDPQDGTLHTSHSEAIIGTLPVAPTTQRQNEVARRKTSSFTIELRNHSGTLNYKKMENWILLSQALVWTVENRKRAIITGAFEDGTPLTLKSMLREAYPKSHVSLITYVEERERIFSKASAEASEYKTVPAMDKTVDKLQFVRENYVITKSEEKECV